MKAKLCIVGVGNCASALVQGLDYYRVSGSKAGLIKPVVAGMTAHDVEVVAAFDVDASKVGLPLSVAIHAGRNCVDIGPVGSEDGAVVVQPAPVKDGLCDAYRDAIRVNAEAVGAIGSVNLASVAEKVRASGANVIVNYLPVGSEEATRFWARVALEARCAFVNCIPVFIASDPDWRKMFAEAGLPLIGDDVKSQVGATILHRQIARLLAERGYVLDSTYQLNVGGNMDFLNLIDKSRIGSKRISKTEAVVSEHPGIDPARVHIGPSDYVGFLGDTKIAFIRCSARGFAGAPLALDIKLEVCDSPNSAGVVFDLVRYAAAAVAGREVNLDDVCAYYMKRPFRQKHEDECDVKVGPESVAKLARA